MSYKTVKDLAIIISVVFVGIVSFGCSKTETDNATSSDLSEETESQATVITNGAPDSSSETSLATYTMQNYVGESYEEVLSEVGKYDIDIRIEYREVADFEEGIVLEQMPAEGTVVELDNSAVTLNLTISKHPDAPEKYVLADYTGLEYTAVVASLRNMGFETALYSENTSNAETGTVIRTDPPANSEVEIGQTICVYYVMDKTIVPNLQGMNLQQAEENLRTANLTGTVEMTEGAAALPESERYIIGTDPAPDTEVTRNSSIILYVGTHEEALGGN